MNEEVTAKITTGKKSQTSNYRSKKRKGSNRSLINSRKKLHSNASKVLTVKESLKEQAKANKPYGDVGNDS